MQSQNLSIGFAVLLAIFAVTTLLTATPASAQTEKVLFNFATPWQPLAGVIFDAAGNLYGTTYQGGSDANCILQFGCGVVFELSPTGEGGWEGRNGSNILMYSYVSIRQFFEIQ